MFSKQVLISGKWCKIEMQLLHTVNVHYDVWLMIMLSIVTFGSLLDHFNFFV